MRVDALGTVRALSAVAGENFSAVLARTDDCTSVITWGNGLNGQLGHSGNIHLGVPRVVEELHGLRSFDEKTNTMLPLNVVQLAAGSNHTLAVLSDGTVLSWGHNNLGQVGSGSRATVREPRFLRTSLEHGACFGWLFFKNANVNFA
jgi:hypothetical protein